MKVDVVHFSFLIVHCYLLFVNFLVVWGKDNKFRIQNLEDRILNSGIRVGRRVVV
jgi:hypothetical protein